MTPDLQASDATSQNQAPDTPPTGRRKETPQSFFFWALSLFLLGMGMKLVMMQRCVNSLPYFDQWEAEAAAIYLPYYQHTLHFSDLFRAQNEHRIFFTHLYDLALLLLNKQWDSQLQMVGNAVIHCATVAGFAWLMAVLFGKRYWLVVWLPAAIAVMSPFGWENALWGFQSQFYFLLLFSLLAISLVSAKPRSLFWFAGWLAGICALFAMASGLLAFVAIAGVIFLEALKSPREWRRYIPALCCCLLLAFTGLFLVGKTPDNQSTTARSLAEFFTSLGHNLSWPMGPWPWLALLNLLPFFVFAWLYARSPEKSHSAERIILGLGFWVVLQSVATAIARGRGAAPPAWRYMDLLCFLLIANVLSLALIFGKYRRAFRFRPLWYSLFAAWLIPCVASLWTLNSRAWNVFIPLWSRFQSNRVALTRAFLATDNENVFAVQDARDLPWLYTSELVALLRTREIVSILPACARKPLKVLPADATSPSPFVPGGCLLSTPEPQTELCFGSYSTNGLVDRGTFESAPLTSSLPNIEIQVTGDIGAPGLNLELVELDSGKVFPVKPARLPGSDWLTVDVKAPAGKFKLVARDDSATGWFAFREPRELGRLSFWAAKTVTAARYFLAAGLITFAAAAGLYFPPGPFRKNSTSFTSFTTT